MSEERSKKKEGRRSARLPAGTAGLFSTLGEKGKGFQIKPIIVIALSIIFIALSILMLTLRI
ncbi:MAG: preprotein translocase subunit Sec61beta [Candidatus Brockarchaeota archaeon]|nr:preprotein translocase subunit Sec61beta [Candidatus Brockarchaeota archaeon]